jgi:predicted Zn finger-like uncharacterized protein
MNVTCTGCPAKYAVPDEKVRGKKVRITCKHCGTNIIVDGSALGMEAGERPKPVAEPATASLHEPLSARATESASISTQAAGVAEVSFLVGFSDDRQESRTLTQIVDMYRTGQLGDDDLVWKDGMADWLSPFDVPQIATAMLKRGVARRATTPEPHADDEATLIVRSPLEDHELALALAQVQAETRSVPLPASPKPIVLAAAAPAAAARRTEKRAAAVDLFGSVAGAGSEDDSSLDFRASDEPAHKLTGARNESSVLFSLAALTKGDAKTSQNQKARDREQEKQASAAWFGESAPDSLLNMGGGGLAALAAPDFTKPVPEIVEPIGQSDPEIAPSAERPKKRSGALLWVALLAVGAAASAAFVMKRSQLLAENAAVAPPTVTLVAAPTAPSATAPPTASPTEAQASAAAPSASQAANLEATASAPSPRNSKLVPVSAPSAAAPPTTTGKLAEPVATNKPAESVANSSKPAEPAAATEAPAFDKGAAVAALGAAAANAASCKNPDGPTGTGKVSVTFAPSGRATATNVVGALAGTEVGGCVARLFRAARVPAFAGDPVTVSKSFSIE